MSVDFCQTWYDIGIVERWFGIANEHISSIFDRIICLRHDNGGVLLFHIFIVGIQHFWGHFSLLAILYPKPSYNEQSYKKVPVYSCTCLKQALMGKP